MPKRERGKARALVAGFEVRLRAQGRRQGGRRRGKLPPLKADSQAIAGARATGETQKKKGRGRPRKQV
jgi:hypothetical protein